MAEMGKYCKAYYARDFRALDGWQENLDHLRPETEEKGGKEVEVPRTELKDDDILYLQETYIVTDGIFNDENVIFDQVTDAWKDACHRQLDFEIPDWEPIEIKTVDESAPKAADDDGEGADESQS